MDRVVATSAKAKSYLQVPSTVVMHGVDTQVFHPTPNRTKLRADLGLPQDALILGCFGRIRAQKGVDLLVEAACALLPARPHLRVIFTGRVTVDNRAFHAAQLARLTAAGVADRVQFLGELPWSDVVRHYQALDLFVAPARWEGFGLTPLEAMACGVPVVASRVGAFESLVTAETGTLVPPDDAAALTQALEAWVDNPARLAAGGLAARAHILANHQIEGEARALVSIYRDMLAAP
jgi:mannosyltransferase